MIEDTIQNGGQQMHVAYEQKAYAGNKQFHATSRCWSLYLTQENDQSISWSSHIL